MSFPIDAGLVFVEGADEYDARVGSGSLEVHTRAENQGEAVVAGD